MRNGNKWSYENKVKMVMEVYIQLAQIYDVGLLFTNEKAKVVWYKS